MNLTRRQVNHVEAAMWDLMEELGLGEDEVVNGDLMDAVLKVLNPPETDEQKLAEWYGRDEGVSKISWGAPIGLINRAAAPLSSSIDPRDVAEMDERKGNGGHLFGCDARDLNLAVKARVCTCDALGWESRRAAAQQAVRDAL